MELFGIVSLILSLTCTTIAQLAQYSPANEKGVSYSVNVPTTSASSDSSDIYFQIQAPASLQWVALGQGSHMAGANIFIIYADASGSNITLSPRLGKGEFQPKFDADTQVSVLAGSGIANNVMTANVRCSSCTTWSGGKMDLSSPSTSWIWAVKEGPPLKSDSTSANLQQHDSMDSFTLDLTKARGGSSLNPFLATGPTSSSGGSSSGGSNQSGLKRATVAHGTIMGLAFVLFFPSGAMIIRLFSFPGVVWVHAGMQAFAYILAVIGLGLGVYIGTTPAYLLNMYHPTIGLLVIGCLVVQPVLGYVHHVMYVLLQRRTLWSTAHVWFGRTVLTLGIINGGLGLRISRNTTGGKIAYGVIAGAVWLTWVGVMIWATLYKSGAEEGSGKGSRVARGRLAKEEAGETSVS